MVRCPICGTRISKPSTLRPLTLQCNVCHNAADARFSLNSPPPGIKVRVDAGTTSISVRASGIARVLHMSIDALFISVGAIVLVGFLSQRRSITTLSSSDIAIFFIAACTLMLVTIEFLRLAIARVHVVINQSHLQVTVRVGPVARHRVIFWSELSGVRVEHRLWLSRSTTLASFVVLERDPPLRFGGFLHPLSQEFLASAVRLGIRQHGNQNADVISLTPLP